MTASNHSPTNHQSVVQASVQNSAENSEETNEETLRQLTGAPDINQPLVSENAFADIDVHSSRPIWKLPVPKLALIAMALVPVFGAVGYFLKGSQSTPQANVPSTSEKSSESDVSAAEASTDPASTELERANKEIATLKSQMALDDQAYVQDNKKSVTPAAASRNQPAQPTPQPTARSQSVNVATRSTPPTVSVSSPPPSIQSSTPPSITPRFNTPASPAAIPDNFVDVDPFEKWRQLAQLGSYGSSNNGELADSTETDIAATRGSNLPLPERAGNSAIPAAYFAATSATGPAYAALDFPEDSVTDPLPEPLESESPNESPLIQAPAENLPTTDEPDILSDAESRILDEQILGTTNAMQSLIAGGYAAGELVTPVVLDSEGVEERFMVVLSEPITNNASRIAIPAGALLAVQVDRVSENGLVQLSATEAIWEEQGFQRELVLPSQTILIRGDHGNPLIAESYGDMGGDIAAMDMGQFALGAIRRVGELYTRSDSRVQTGDSTTVITESNPAPNILAGVLEGGSDAILDAISERNQQAIERLRSQPRVPHIPAGSSVQIFINRSIQMPSGL